MMRLLFFFLFGVVFVGQCLAQSKHDTLRNHVVESLLSKPAPGQGSISIEQDSLIGWLLNKYESIKTTDNKIDGWRVQIYNSSGKEAREEANDMRNKFLNIFSSHKAYLIYQPPFFKIRVGDFRTKQEAFELYKSALKFFPVSYVLQDKINLPPLE
jgi:hypothetical protein